MVAIPHIQKELIKACQSWARKQGFDPVQARELRREAILRNHEYYLENIPAYRKLAQEEGISRVADIETIKKKLMFPDEIFKSYSQEWLDGRDFSRMNRWLSGIYHKRIDADIRGVNSIDDWLEGLGRAGINVSFSSGTSGAFSFVPRDEAGWNTAKTANICYLAPLLARQKLESPGRFPLKQAVKLLSPEAFARVVGKTGLPDFDAFFLGFRRGRMGNQALMQELAPVFRKHYFLYDMDLTASALRCLRRGARSEDEQKLVEQLQNQVIVQREKNYLRLAESIRASTGGDQKVFIFGAPYQFKELCEVMSDRKIPLHKGSLILFGGGWKSFTGEIMERETLVKSISDCFILQPERILEGYSMTEISLLMVRCDHGRFHVPPLIEPLVFDDELNPIEGKDTGGTFGFMDPLAVSYPGFIISGDHVHLVDGECKCGLTGPAITEIGRARGRAIKGCGGIMGSITA